MMNLVLIGYRGTGKTATAQVLARRLGWPVVDADDEIEARAGKTIAQIFADEGEPVFRALESRVVADLAQRARAVLSLGGGAVMRPENRQAIAGSGHVVWLTASAETIWQRVNADRATASRRPNLTAGGGIDEIVATLRAREPVYRQCADFVVDTEQKTPEQVADAIVGQWPFLTEPDGGEA